MFADFGWFSFFLVADILTHVHLILKSTCAHFKCFVWYVAVLFWSFVAYSLSLNFQVSILKPNKLHLFKTTLSTQRALRPRLHATQGCPRARWSWDWTANLLMCGSACRAISAALEPGEGHTSRTETRLNSDSSKSKRKMREEELSLRVSKIKTLVDVGHGCVWLREIWTLWWSVVVIF